MYRELWQTLEPLAKYGVGSRFTRDEATTFAVELRKWYFHTGGLFLSTAGRADFFALQDALRQLTSDDANTDNPLPRAIWEHLRVSGSRLRTSLTYDVGTRRKPKLPGRAEPFDRTLAGRYTSADAVSADAVSCAWT